MSLIPRRLGTPLLALALVAAVAAAACGGGTSSKDKTATAAKGGAKTPAAGATKAAAKIDIAGVDELKDGTLDIGSDIAYAPVEFVDEKTQAPSGLTWTSRTRWPTPWA